MRVGWVGLAALALLAGCLGDVGVVCEDGTTCPDGTSCQLVSGQVYCAAPAEVAACADLTAGATCTRPSGEAGVCNGGVCLALGCGDGFRTGSEDCDRDQLGDATTCRDLGWYSDAALGCKVDCTYDETACAEAGRCGDGLVDPDEQCEPADGERAEDLAGEDCTTAGGYYRADGLHCNAACRFDFAACSGRCGDGTWDDGVEDCEPDQALPAGGPQTCGDIGDGFYQDVDDPLGCSAACRFDTSACDEVCGDGIRQGTEECDGVDVPATTDTCGELSPGFYYDVDDPVTCTASCRLDTSACDEHCGDGAVNGAEECDGAALPATTCGEARPGFFYDTDSPVTCAPSCRYDLSACEEFCGDGVISGAEQCDPSVAAPGAIVLPEVDTCGEVPGGFYDVGDPVGCTATCQLDIRACDQFCGDGQINGGEDCDGASLPTDRDTCGEASGGFYYDAGDPVVCAPSCRLDLTACDEFCGDGTIQSARGEACDGANVPPGSDTCGEVSSAYYDAADPVTCGGNCQLNLSACDEFCGDGTVQPAFGEQCEGNGPSAVFDAGLDLDADGVDCSDFAASSGNPFYGGTLGCDPSCGVATFACAGFCGDNIVQAGEACDGTNPGAFTCDDPTPSYWFGVPGCAADCQTPIYTDGDELSPPHCYASCGDGRRNGPELCDGGDVPVGITCEAFGYYGGSITCASSCTALSDDGCAGYCGDGVADEANEEACDGFDQAFAPGDLGCSAISGNGALGCNRFCQPVFDTCQDSEWDSIAMSANGVPLDPAARVLSATATSGRDAWVIVQQPTGISTLHFDGETWTQATTAPTDARVIFAAGEYVWLGTTNGQIWTLGTGESFSPTMTFAQPIQSLWGTAAGEVFAVVGVLANDTGQLYTQPSPTSGWVPAGLPSGVRGVTGNGTTVLAWYANQARLRVGTTWVASPSIATTDMDLIRAGWVGSDKGVVLVGHNDLNNAAIEWRLQPSSAYRVLTVPSTGGGATNALAAVVGGATNDLWFVGLTITATATPELVGTLYHYDGATVTDEGSAITPAPRLRDGAGVYGPSPTQPLPADVIPGIDLAASDGGDLWMVGGERTVEHYDGVGWQQPAGFIIPVPAWTAASSVAVSTSAVWLGTPNFVRQFYLRRAAETSAGISYVRDIAIAGSTNRQMWANPDGSVWAIDASGTSTIARVINPDTNTITSSTTITSSQVPLDVWGDGAGTTAANRMLVLTASSVWTRRSGAWTEQVLTNAADTSATIWGTSTDAYIAASAGLLDGHGNLYAAWPAGFSPADVWATEGGDVWIVGSRALSGVILRYAAGTFTELTIPSGAALTSVWGRHASDVWMVGAQGRVLHWDGSRVVRIDAGVGPSSSFLGLAGLAAGASPPMVAALTGNDVLTLSHDLPAVGGADVVDAAPLACAESPITLRTTTGPAGATGTWFRLDAPRAMDWQLEVIPRALTALPAIRFEVYEANAIGRRGRAPHNLLLTSTYVAMLDRASAAPLALQSGRTYYLKVSAGTTDDQVPVDLISSCTRP